LRALPMGELHPGARLEGYVYFLPLRKDARRLTLEFHHRVGELPRVLTLPFEVLRDRDAATGGEVNIDLAPLPELVLDTRLPPPATYAALFLSCILESFFPPWPTDVIALYAGFLAGRGQLEHGVVLAIAITGTRVG